MYIDQIVKEGEESKTTKIEVRIIPGYTGTYQDFIKDCKQSSSSGKAYEKIAGEYREVK